MPHALAPATPVPTPDQLQSHEDGLPVTLGYTPDQMPVVIWPRGDDPSSRSAASRSGCSG